MGNIRNILGGVTIAVTTCFIVLPAAAQQSVNLFAEILPATNGIKIDSIDFKTIVPEPIKNLTDKANGLQMDLNSFPRLKSAVDSVRGVVGDPADIVRDPGSWWARMNNWLRAKVGFDFRQVAKAIGGLFLWILDMIKELVTWVISKV